MGSQLPLGCFLTQSFQHPIMDEPLSNRHNVKVSVRDSPYLTRFEVCEGIFLGNAHLLEIFRFRCRNPVFAPLMPGLSDDFGAHA